MRRGDVGRPWRMEARMGASGCRLVAGGCARARRDGGARSARRQLDAVGVDAQVELGGGGGDRARAGAPGRRGSRSSRSSAAASRSAVAASGGVDGQQDGDEVHAWSLRVGRT